jgi:hypothetical protein
MVVFLAALALICFVAAPIAVVRLTKTYQDRERRSDPQAEEAARQRDGSAHRELNELIAYFVAQMARVGSPGQCKPPHWDRSPVMEKVSLGKFAKIPFWAELGNGGWWLGYCFVGTNGQWEYLTKCFSRVSPSVRRDGEVFAAWWATSNDYCTPSLRRGSPYPGNTYEVVEPREATHKDALRFMTAFMYSYLERYRPEVLPEFRRLAGYK